MLLRGVSSTVTKAYKINIGIKSFQCNLILLISQNFSEPYKCQWPYSLFLFLIRIMSTFFNVNSLPGVL